MQMPVDEPAEIALLDNSRMQHRESWEDRLK